MEHTKHDKIENDDNLDWLDDFLIEIKRVAKEDAHYYIFCSMHNVDIFVSKVKKHLPYKNLLIWEKNNTWMWDLEWDYAPKYELIIYCTNWEKKLSWNRDPNILKFSRTTNEMHPTQKPVDLFSYLIDKSSEKGDSVLDPFAGSWTTGVACVNMGRECTLIEKEPKYFEVMERRVKNANPSLF